MPITNALNTLIPTFTVDPVAVFDNDFKRLFSDAQAIKAVVKEQSKLMEHPVESGIIITDHRIVLPVEIDLSLVLSARDYQTTYKQIRQYYLNATLLVIQTRSGVYENQIIQGMPHEEDPEQFNVLMLALSLKQVQFVTAEYGVVPKYANNSANTSRGAQPTTTPTASQATIAGSGFSGLKRATGYVVSAIGSLF